MNRIKTLPEAMCELQVQANHKNVFAPRYVIIDLIILCYQNKYSRIDIQLLPVLWQQIVLMRSLLFFIFYNLHILQKMH